MAGSKAKRLLSGAGGYSNPPGPGEDIKVEAAEEILTAIKERDADALCYWLETFIECCEGDASVKLEVK